MQTHDVTITASDIWNMANVIYEQMVRDNNGSKQDVPSLELVTKALQSSLEQVVEDMVKHPSEEAHPIAIEFAEWLKFYERREKRKQEANHV